MTEEEQRARLKLAQAQARARLQFGVSKSPESKSTGQKVKEFFLGDDDPTTQNLGEKIGAGVNKFAEGLSFGLVGDEANARFDAVVGRGSYDERLKHYRDQEALLEETNPGAAAGAEIAGAITTGLSPIGIGAKIASKAAPQVLRSVSEGAAYGAAGGALHGFMEGEGEGRFDEAKRGALYGGAFGGTGAGIGAAVARRAARNRRQASERASINEAPSTDEMFEEASVLYGAGRNRGKILEAEQGSALRASVREKLTEEGLMRRDGSLISRDPEIRQVLKELDAVAEHGVEGSQVKALRQVFGKGTATSSATRRRIGGIIQREFDEAVERVAPEFAQGDAVYSRAKRVEAVDETMKLADQSERANAMRSEFAKMDRKEISGRLPGFEDFEIDAIRNVSRSDGGTRAKEALSKVSPSNPVGFGLVATPAAFGVTMGEPLTGTALTLGAAGLGSLSRRSLQAEQRRRAEIAKAIIARGKPLEASSAATPSAKVVAAILASPGLTGQPQ